MNRTQLINKLIQEYGYESYLEIGLGKEKNFKSIQCNLKTGVDPSFVSSAGLIYGLTSDDFFAENNDKYDLIFIDGDHDGYQVEKDIVNAWNCLNKGGIILLHDINPPTKESQQVPKVSSPWKGTVWRAFVGFMQKYDKIKAYTTKHDAGIGWIFKSRHKLETGFYNDTLTYEEFDQSRGTYLRIV